MFCVTRGAKAEKIRIKAEKLRAAKADARKRGIVARLSDDDDDVRCLLKRHSSIDRLPGRYVQARSAIPSSALSSQGGAGGKLSCPRHDICG